MLIQHQIQISNVMNPPVIMHMNVFALLLVIFWGKDAYKVQVCNHLKVWTDFTNIFCSNSRLNFKIGFHCEFIEVMIGYVDANLEQYLTSTNCRYEFLLFDSYLKNLNYILRNHWFAFCFWKNISEFAIIVRLLVEYVWCIFIRILS